MTVKDQNPAARSVPAASGGGLGGNTQICHVPPGRFHLAGDKAAPDQIVQLVLLVTEKLSDIRRRKVNVGGADSPMRLLGAFLGGVRAETEENNGISNLTSAMLLKGTKKRKEGRIKAFMESRNIEV